MELWYFHHSYLNVPGVVPQSEAIIDQAAAAGYTGLALWDTGINDLQYGWWNPAPMQQVIQYALSKGLKVMPLVAPFGHSSDMVRMNWGWGEGERVIGTQFQVDPQGQTLQPINSFPGLINGGFEQGKTGWFTFGDAGTTVDYTVHHSGTASGLITPGSGNSRFNQTFTVQPWRQYHMQMYTKTQNFSGYAQVLIYGDNNYAYNRVNTSLNTPANADWTVWDYTFNSGPHTTMSILMGEWGGSQGNLWFDDISLQETALVYVQRGPSVPLSVYDPANPSHIFQENTDFGAVSDPKFNTDPTFDDNWHQPMTIPVPAGSSLKPGQIVAMNWYAIQPCYGDAGASLTDPGAWQWVQQNTAAVGTMFPNSAGYFLGYDEMRNMNGTASAVAKNMTPAQLLDWHFGQVYQLYRQLNATTPIYTWSDMFDPNHNAVNNYYLVEGDLTGSWTGLPSDVILMNWNLGNLTTSTKWFSGQNPQQPVAHKQVIAGYYDSGNGASSASTELSQVAGIPGVIGMMYTTFSNDYSQLANFANAARTGWTAYQATLPQTNPAGTAAFVKADTTTQGNWKAAYGVDGYNVAGDLLSNPSYATPTMAGQTPFVWIGSTPDVRGLQKPSNLNDRIGSAWYSPSVFTIDVNSTDQLSHQVAIYCVNWDSNPRTETVDVLDVNGNVLNTRKLTSFVNGEYLVWNITGHVTFRVTNNSGINAIVAGLFFGGAPPPPVLPSATAAFVKADTTTQGNWKTAYGVDGYNVSGDTFSNPSYAAPTMSGQTPFVWIASTPDVRALQKASNPSDRVGAAWYSPAMFTIDVNPTDQLQHQVALYCVDWDNNIRRETVDVLDANGNILNTQKLTGSFNAGVYLVWTIKGHVTFRITNNTGTLNALVSGVFFGAQPIVQPTGPSAVFVKADTTTQGNWKGVYGADGYNVSGDLFSYPAYVVPAMTGQLNFVWTPSTPDVRALQKPSNPADRIAGVWYSPTAFAIDVNPTDQLPHQVALYCLDWDSGQRTQTITVQDVNGNLLNKQVLTNFTGGTYLVWTVTGHVTFHVTDNSGANAIVEGLFFR